MRKEYLILGFVLLITLIFPLVVLYLYREYVTGIPVTFSLDGVSRDSGKWSDFGSLLSGLFTLSGAVAALAALLFAIFQNRQLSDEAKKRSVMDQETARKNESFMIFQQERMNFEKFRMHQLMFNDLLDKVEVDAFNNFAFKARMIFYKKIFSNNSFSKCDTKVDLTDVKAGSLKDILDCVESINVKMKSEEYFDSPHVLVDDISTLHSLLMLTVERTARDGDIIFAGKFIVLNVVDLHNDLVFLSDAVNALCTFCEVDTRVSLTTHLSLGKTIITLINYAGHFDFSKVQFSTYPYSFKSELYLSNLAELYKIFAIDKNSPLYPFFKNLNNYILDALGASNIHHVTSIEGYLFFLNSFKQRVSSAISEAMIHDVKFLTIGEYYLGEIVKMSARIKN
ncbi:hypothetical protein [Pantoea cypripedii]|nr:hypothetical protein [Pantoea cypripedii]